MSVFRDLLRIKTFRENQAESRVRQARAVALDAQQAREAAEALLARLLREGHETEHRLYRELCERIVRLREIEDVQHAVVGLRQREAAQHDAVQSALGDEQRTEQALAAAREVHRQANRQKTKFIDLSRDYDLGRAREAERKEDLEMEEAASVRREREDWDAHHPEEAMP